MLLPLRTVLTLVVVFLPLCLSLPSLKEKFYTHAILSPRHLEVRVKKDTRGRVHSKAMRLPLFGRKLSLLFKPGSLAGILTPDASLHAVHANGTESPIHLDPADFHQGVIRGYTNSWVSGVYHDGLWAIQARHPALSFSVEPLVFHTGGNDAIHRMVAYRHSDVRPRNGVDRQKGNKTDASFCSPFESTAQYKNLKSSFEYAIHQKERRKAKISSREINNPVRNGWENTAYYTSRRNRSNTRSKQINKRDSSPHMICDILAISDYYLYKHYAGESVNRVARLLVQAYQMADHIFSHTDFGVDFSVGLRIRRMKVLASDDRLGIGDLFNAMDDDLDPTDLIKAFTRLPYARQYCHAHLTSGRSFQGSVLGLAYTAMHGSQRPPMGICGGLRNHSYNVGLTTFKAENSIVPISEYSIMLTHEIGHSFGAFHDTPESPAECRPKEVQGGLYVMWSYANKGYSKNNYMFSTCSKRQIEKTLMKRPQCLIPLEQIELSRCGNGILDYGEDCDAGFSNLDDPHGCCTHKCRFTRHAICSPYNHPCCQNCTVATPSQTCVNALEHACMEPAHCDGVQFHSCPSSRAKPNGQLCRNHGECQNGDCVSYCSLFGQRLEPPELFVPCICDKNRKDMCSLCCRKMVFNQSLNEMECRPHSKTYDDGTQCMMGTCKGGNCLKMELLDGQDTLVLPLIDKTEDDSYTTHVIYASLILICIVIFIAYTLIQKYKRPNDRDSTCSNSNSISKTSLPARNVTGTNNAIQASDLILSDSQQTQMSEV